jgi:hypothetical protein
MNRSLSVAVFALGSLLLCAGSGCKQDIGERCEKSSDCASGFCGGDNSDVGMASAVGKTCTPGRVTVSFDAGTTQTMPDAAADRPDGADAPAGETGDVASESHAEAGEAGAGEGGTDGSPVEAGAETSASDGAVDLLGDTLASDSGAGS